VNLFFHAANYTRNRRLHQSAVSAGLSSNGKTAGEPTAPSKKGAFFDFSESSG
jgi:hypothetical protein